MQRSRDSIWSPVCEPDDERWGAEWFELLALEPASKLALGNEALDPAQQFLSRKNWSIAVLKV